MQVLAADILMRVSIVKIVCECFPAMTGKPALERSYFADETDDIILPPFSQLLLI